MITLISLILTIRLISFIGQPCIWMVRIERSGGRLRMANSRVQVLDEVIDGPEGDWRLCFQRCRYIHDDGRLEDGFRFIWRRQNGTLQGARGQARLPSISLARRLMAQAEQAGWGHFDADNSEARFT